MKYICPPLAETIKFLRTCAGGGSFIESKPRSSGEFSQPDKDRTLQERRRLRTEGMDDYAKCEFHENGPLSLVREYSMQASKRARHSERGWGMLDSTLPECLHSIKKKEGIDDTSVTVSAINALGMARTPSNSLYSKASQWADTLEKEKELKKAVWKSQL